MFRISTLGLLLLTGACGDDEMTTKGSDSTSSASAEVTETGEASTTDAPPTTGDDTTTGDDSTTADATTLEPGTSTEATTEATSEATSEATTDSDTTGEQLSDLAVCQDYCDRYGDCGIQPDLDGCVQGCVDMLTEVPPSKCKTATQDMLVCAATLACEELPLIMEGTPEQTACGDKWAQANLICDEDECSQSGGGSDTECEVVIECGEEQPYKMLCDEQTCTCYEGDAAVSECASEGICAADDGLFVKFTECCGG